MIRVRAPESPRCLLPLAALGLLLPLAAPAAAQPEEATAVPAAEVSDDDPGLWARLALERLSELEICRPEGAEEDMLCGVLSVWEDREAAAGRKIDLAVVVVPARTEDPDPAPVVPLAGGPGGSVTGQAAGIAKAFPEVVAKRDLLLVDQRGTGKSHPLQCSFGITPESPHGAYDGMFPLDAVEACREELGAKADLTKYTTTVAVGDLEEVRRRLGYERLNLAGGSYGTRFAQEFLRRHPGSVRTAMLQGVVSMDQRMPLHHAVDGQRSLDLLLVLCEEDPVCRGRYPRLRGELWEVLERLEEEPGRATVENPFTGEPVELSVGRAMFAESLRSTLYSVPGSAEIPFIVHRAHEGDFGPFFRATLPWRVMIETELANGLYLSITCAEDVPFFTEEDAARLNAGTALGDFRTAAQRAACAVWPRAEIPGDFREPVATDLPVLIVDGELDPVTPPRYGREAAEHMPASLFVLIPRAHHDYDGLTNQECIEDLILEFLDTGTTEGLDPSCVATMQRPPYVTEESGMGYAE